MSSATVRDAPPDDLPHEKRRRIRRALLLFLALSAFMYVSITYKIINFGP